MTKLKNLIEARSCSLTKLANDAKVSRQTLYNIQRGKTVSLTTLKLICRYFNVDYKNYLEE